MWRADDLRQAPPVDELRAAVEALRDRPEATETIRSLSCPLLVVVGDNDPLMSLDEGRLIASLAPAGRFEAVPAAGHLPSLDNPQHFDALLKSFLAEI